MIGNGRFELVMNSNLSFCFFCLFSGWTGPVPILEMGGALRRKRSLIEGMFLPVSQWKKSRAIERVNL